MFAEQTIRSQALDVQSRLLGLIQVVQHFNPSSYGACGNLRKAQKLVKLAVQRLLADWSLREARALLLVIESVTASLYKTCFDETTKRANGIQGEPIAPELIPMLRAQAVQGLQAFGVLVEALIRAKSKCGSGWVRRVDGWDDGDVDNADLWGW